MLHGVSRFEAHPPSPTIQDRSEMAVLRETESGHLSPFWVDEAENRILTLRSRTLRIARFACAAESCANLTRRQSRLFSGPLQRGGAVCGSGRCMFVGPIAFSVASLAGTQSGRDGARGHYRERAHRVRRLGKRPCGVLAAPDFREMVWRLGTDTSTDKPPISDTRTDNIAVVNGRVRPKTRG